ncbi:hypothetical protein M569_11355 [Genlisea aurea]|uniref:Uncharacterized protein n=1 Tax=Genlisea aurea TaxID=192259 RepID=S8CFZ3_9LAMI|nr:hypothetical protein M569_11355 [Genlisea aurea]
MKRRSETRTRRYSASESRNRQLTRKSFTLPSSPGSDFIVSISPRKSTPAIYSGEHSTNLRRLIYSEDKTHKSALPLQNPSGETPVSRAREFIARYINRAKLLYQQLSQKQARTAPTPAAGVRSRSGNYSFCKMKNWNQEIVNSINCSKEKGKNKNGGGFSSCPSSAIQSPCHVRSGSMHYSDLAELQNAIQGAISHCKNSLTKNNNDESSNAS